MTGDLPDSEPEKDSQDAEQEESIDVIPGATPSVFHTPESQDFHGIRCITLCLSSPENSEGTGKSQPPKAEKPRSRGIKVLTEAEIEALRQETKAAMAQVKEWLRKKRT